MTHLYADYRAHYYQRSESPRRQCLLAVPRILVNPSMHAVILMRLCSTGPRWLFFVWRNILVAKHSIDVGPSCAIGPGLNLPHPFGIVLGTGVSLGRNVMLYHNVTLGTRRAPRRGESLGVPRIGDDVIVHPNTVIVGPVSIGSASIIGANCVIDRDVPPGQTVSHRTAAMKENGVTSTG